MKIRIDFITNSSSSSFIINRKDITDEQIKDLMEKNEELGEQAWNIEIKEDSIRGCVQFDDFNMIAYLMEILKVEKMETYFID